VAVFQPQLQGTPQLYGDSIPIFLSVGYNESSDLFLLGVSGFQKRPTKYLAELPEGGSAFEPISLNLGPHVPEVSAVQWDGKYVTIEGAYRPGEGKPKTWQEAVYRLKISSSTATVSQRIIQALGVKTSNADYFFAATTPSGSSKSPVKTAIGEPPAG
jgi:hypothetical protein